MWQGLPASQKAFIGGMYGFGPLFRHLVLGARVDE